MRRVSKASKTFFKVTWAAGWAGEDVQMDEIYLAVGQKRVTPKWDALANGNMD